MLDICKLLFGYLNFQNIRYCHWKSNAHLEKALEGDTDLDILVHRDDQKRFESALEKFDLKQILSPPEKQYPGIEDHVGFDPKTGSLIHLHVHYSLVLGQKYIKNHHLPIENIIFQNCNKQDSISVVCPEIELILLIIRAHLKVDFISIMKHGLKNLFGYAYTAFPVNIEKEFDYLINRSDMEKLRDILLQFDLPLLKKMYSNFVKKFSEGRIGWYDILKSKMIIFSALKKYRRQKGLLIRLKYLYLVISNGPGINKIRKARKKTLPGRGKIVSIVGADGSGKSTLVKDIDNWLSWKLSVNRYYYGIPKINYLKFLSFVIRGCKKLNLNYFSKVINCYLWIYIAKKRLAIYVKSQIDVDAGKVVLTDRFPLKVFQNMEEPMDGPRLKNSSKTICSYFTTVEARYYDKVKLPDRVFVLQATIEELRRRKTDLGLKKHELKAAVVNAIGGDAGIVLVDANRSYSEVLFDLKRKIWELL